MPKLKKKKNAARKRTLRVKKPARRRKNLARKRTKKMTKIRKKMQKKPRKKIVARKVIKKSVRRAKARKSKKVISWKVKKIVRRKAPQHTIKKPVGEFPAESLFKAKIKVIGVGGGGGSIVSEIGRSLKKATFVIADTDIRALKKRSGIKYFWFGQDLTHGLGTGVNIDLARQAAESAKEKISGVFQDQDIIIFVASLGGGLGSGATQVFADAAREFGGITFGIFTTPFKFEGKNKSRIAQNALKSLRKSLNVSLVIPNEKIFKIIDETTPIINAFSTVNKSLIESLESLIDLIHNPGIINIDFADLRTILRGRGNSAFLNTIEESGKDRVEKICEKIFKNPLLQSNSFKAEKILFNIAGSESLSMFEVEKISSHIASLNPKAKIIFGISKNSKLKNKIKTTILTTGVPPGVQIEEETIKAKPVYKMGSAKIASVEQIKESPKKEVKVGKKGKPNPPKNKKIGFWNRPKKLNKKDRKLAHKGRGSNEKGDKAVSFIPVFQVPESVGHSIEFPALEQKKIGFVETASSPNKKTIRRNALEIKKAEEVQEKKRIAQEKEWEIPAFLRKVKFKS